MTEQKASSSSFLRWREIPGGVWTLGFVSLLMDVSSEMIHALLPLYLAAGFGASMLTIGVIEGLAEATALVTRVFSGAISDALGKRKLLAAIGYGLAAFTKPIFPLAPSIAWVVAARVIDRIGKGIRGAPRDALIADLAPAEMRGASFGLRQSLDTIGAFVGPLAAIGLMLLLADNFTAVFWIAVVPAFASFLLIAFAVREPERAAPNGPMKVLDRASIRALPRAYWLVVGLGALFTLGRFSEAFLILRAQQVGLGLALAPLALIVMNLAYAPMAWPAGALSDKIGRFGVLAIGFALLAGAQLVLALATGVAAVLVGVILWGLHLGFTQGVFAALVADTATPDLRGAAFGVFHFVSGVAMLAAGVVAGALWDAIGPQATFFAGAGFVVAALAVSPLVRRLAFR